MSLYNQHFDEVRTEVFSNFEKTASAEDKTDPNALIKLATDIQGKMAARGFVEGQLKTASAQKTIQSSRENIRHRPGEGAGSEII